MRVRERVVVVLGAGNLRCGPTVLASLAAWRPDDLVDIRLWDANEERLDLFDRLLRECLDKEGTQHNVRSSSDFAIELEGATDVVFCVHEDCARRVSGRSEPLLFESEVPEALVDQVRGDPNKPTLPDHLSPHTHVILSAPLDQSESREVVVTRALEALLACVPESARILSLQRGVARLPRDCVALDWPPPVPERDLPVIPHQVLRWIHGEESLAQLLSAAMDSPVYGWLVE